VDWDQFASIRHLDEHCGSIVTLPGSTQNLFHDFFQPFVNRSFESGPGRLGRQGSGRIAQTEVRALRVGISSTIRRNIRNEGLGSIVPPVPSVTGSNCTSTVVARSKARFIIAEMA
jgi:hypothetical protein